VKLTKSIAVLSLIGLPSSFANSQNPNERNSKPDIELNAKLVGGPCEGCEAVFEYGHKKLFSIDTFPSFGGI